MSKQEAGNLSIEDRTTNFPKLMQDLAQSILQLSTAVNDNTAAILSEQTARSNADSALAQDISGLTAKVDDNAAAILNEQTARADADSALAQDIQTLAAQIDDNTAAS